MKNWNWPVIITSLVALGLASVSPNSFPAALGGYGSLHDFGLYLILPSALLLGVLYLVTRGWGDRRTSSAILYGAVAGFLATFALELVRYPAFRMGLMPGNMPELLGVLLFDRFAQGPSTASTLTGNLFHFWNGACFGIIYAILAGLKRPVYWPIVYASLIGLGFMVSPVVESLGVGWFGVDYGPGFAATVVLAHLAWGTAFWFLLKAISARTAASAEPAGHQGQHHAMSSGV